MHKYMLMAAVAVFFCSAPPAFSGQEARLFDHSMELTVDIPNRTVTGTDTIRLATDATEVELFLREGSSVEGVTYAGRALAFKADAMKDERASRVSIRLDGPGGELVVRFGGTFPGVESAREGIRRGVAYVEDGVIGPDGVLLPSSSLWYPREYGRLHTARATVTIEAGYRTVMEGELTESVEAGGRTTETWVVEKPVDGLDLVAARFVVEEREHRGIKLYTFFFEKDKRLSETYLEKTAGYIDLYSGMIAPYPFKKFAVVENFLPTGYGMPSFTLLGSTVLRLPFIPDTSLGHEVAHSWWGNSVYMDGAGGNWVEALTTYTSDHLYARKKGKKEASENRLEQVRGYANYAGATATALKDFNDATTPSTRAVGYNKGMMVFNMLETELGGEAFNDGLKQLYLDHAFSRASWADIRSSFEAASGTELGWFFDQWVSLPGGPRLKLSAVTVGREGDAYTTEFEITQHTKEPYRLTMPVAVHTAGGDLVERINVKKTSEKFKIRTAQAPLGLTIDPEYQNFRLLWPEELPPSFGACFGDPATVAVLPSDELARAKYAAAAESLARDFELETGTDAEAGVRDFIGASSLLVFGSPEENRVARLAGVHLASRIKIEEKSFIIEGTRYDLPGTVAAVAVRNAKDPSKTICLMISGAGGEETLRAAQRLRYFSMSGFIVFPGGDKVEEGRFEGKNLLNYNMGR